MRFEKGPFPVTGYAQIDIVNLFNVYITKTNPVFSRVFNWLSTT